MITDLESGIWEESEEAAARHELLMALPLPPEQLRLLIKPVGALNWARGSRAPTVLRYQNIEWTWQLAMRTESELIRVKGIGRTTLNEIRSKLEAHGLSLGMELFEGAPPPKPPE